jgi:hypothetical protein
MVRRALPSCVLTTLKFLPRTIQDMCFALQLRTTLCFCYIRIRSLSHTPSRIWKIPSSVSWIRAPLSTQLAMPLSFKITLRPPHLRLRCVPQQGTQFAQWAKAPSRSRLLPKKVGREICCSVQTYACDRHQHCFPRGNLRAFAIRYVLSLMQPQDGHLFPQVYVARPP